MGAFLRRFSLDELPNLVNVLRGEMSIVGPRPTIQAQVDQYTERQRRRLEVKPGITGWAQVNGRASLPWHERIELDVWYVDHRSLALDLKILAAHGADARDAAHGLYKGETGGWTADRVAVLLTGVGKRYDIVSAFAEHAFVIAADPNPLAPAQYAADVRVAPPRDRRPRLRPVPRRSSSRSTTSRPSSRSPTSTSRCCARADAAGVRPGARRLPRDLRQVRDARAAARARPAVSPPTVLPGEEPESYPVMVKPRQGSGARSIHPAADRARWSSSSTTSKSR